MREKKNNKKGIKILNSSRKHGKNCVAFERRTRVRPVPSAEGVTRQRAWETTSRKSGRAEVQTLKNVL